MLHSLAYQRHHLDDQASEPSEQPLPPLPPLQPSQASQAPSSERRVLDRHTSVHHAHHRRHKHHRHDGHYSHDDGDHGDGGKSGGKSGGGGAQGGGAGQAQPSQPSQPSSQASSQQRTFCFDAELGGWALAGPDYAGCTADASDDPADGVRCCMTKAELDALPVTLLDASYYSQICRCPAEGLRRQCQYLVNDEDARCA